MRIIAIKTLRDFWGMPEYRDAEHPLRAWYAEAKKANWKGPEKIKEDYRSASIVGNNRVVFNIRGNKYRLVVAARYEIGLVFVRFIGTHARYDKIDARRI
jgi:mRNA interferase HigB